MERVRRLPPRARRLRGTVFDVFGYTEERRTERALAREFEHTLDILLAGLDAESLPAAAEVVNAYMDIRGYGPVKAQSVDEVRDRVAKQLASMRRCDVASESNVEK